MSDVATSIPTPLKVVEFYITNLRLHSWIQKDNNTLQNLYSKDGPKPFLDLQTTYHIPSNEI